MYTGNLAINPRDSSLEISLGGNISLQVYVAGIPSVMSDEVMWHAPDGSRIISGGRRVLQKKNTCLFIVDVNLADAGSYRIDIRRSMNTAVATSSISLDIHGNVVHTYYSPLWGL